jgi:hypothetical protein
MEKLILLKQFLENDATINKYVMIFEPVAPEAEGGLYQLDPQRIRLNLGTRSLYIFGKTERGVWVYFITVYEDSGKPAGPMFYALPGAEQDVLSFIKEQIDSYINRTKDS